MIASVSGKISETGEGYIVVESSAGVGYRIAISPADRLWDTIAVGDELTICTSHQVRENEENLYGFVSPEERNFFEQLLTVSGVGPKIASSLVAGVGQKQLAEMILTEDVEGIDAVPGIGKKMAERIIIDLRDKVFGDTDKVDATARRRSASDEKEEIAVVRQALERLGFNARERENMVDGLQGDELDGKSVETILKQLLAKK